MAMNDNFETANREIRVFLSSTFRDMDAERDYLLQTVFPRFRQDCAGRNVGFTEIDLRWGVTEEASKNGSTVEICLSEIDRCREYPPFFIGFMGERYGWIPQAADLAAYWTSHADSRYAGPIRSSLEEGISVTELEMRFGVLDHLHSPTATHAHFFLRDPELTAHYCRAAVAGSATAREADFYDNGQGRLERFKQQLRDSGMLDLDGYRSVAEFGERIYAILLEGLNERYPADLVPDPVAQRAQSHARFSASRLQAYVPLAEMREQVRTALAPQLDPARTSHELLYLTAPSGAGKSAFMADLARWLPQAFPGALVHARFCGADGGRSIGLWRDDLFAILRNRNGVSAGDEESAFADADDEGKWQALAGELATVQHALNAPILLLIDAIDQLDAPAEALHALAAQYWPSGVAVVVSGLPEYAAEAGYAAHQLERLAPSQRARMIDAFTANYRKALAPDQVKLLAHHPRTEIALYLKMVLEDIRIYSHHETLMDDIASLLSFDDADTLFAHQLQSWDKTYGDAAHPRLASDLAMWLALAREGLDETELADLLAAPADPVSMESGRPRLPTAFLSPLLAVLRPYLLRNEGRESLMHLSLSRGAQPSGERMVVAREKLAAYFNQPTARAFAERLHQRVVLAQAAPTDRACRDALAKVAGQLASAFLLRDKDAPLMMAALQILRSDASAIDMATPVIGPDWAHQLAHMCTGADQKVIGIFLDCAGLLAVRLHHWAYYADELPLSEALVALRRQHGLENDDAYFPGILNLALVYGELGRDADAQELLAEGMTKLSTRFNTARTSVSRVLEMAMCNFLNATAKQFQKHGKMEQALGALRRELELSRAFFPRKHRAIGDALNDLGACYLAAGRFGDARECFEETLAIDEATSHVGDGEKVAILSNMGRVYGDQGMLLPAEQYLLRALEIARSGLPGYHPLTVNALNGLGVVYRKSDKLEQAETYAQEAVAMARQRAQGMRSQLAVCLSNLGAILQAREKFREAEHAFADALSIFTETDIERAQALNNLASLYEQQGLQDKALQYYEQSLSVRRTLLSANHPMIALALSNLCHFYGRQGALDKATAYGEEALAIAREALPAGHPEIGNALNNAGIADEMAGRPEAAAAKLVEALAIFRGIAPINSGSVVQLLARLATLSIVLQRKSDAAVYLDDALALKNKLATGHAVTLCAVGKVLADACVALGRGEQAEAWLVAALDTARKVWPGGGLAIAAYIENLAAFYFSEGLPAQSEPLLRESLAIYRTHLPPGHEAIGITQANLAGVIAAIGERPTPLPAPAAPGNAVNYGSSRTGQYSAGPTINYTIRPAAGAAAPGHVHKNKDQSP